MILELLIYRPNFIFKMESDKKIEFREITRVLSDVMTEHPDINFDEIISECLDIENEYRVRQVYNN